MPSSTRIKTTPGKRQQVSNLNNSKHMLTASSSRWHLKPTGKWGSRIWSRTLSSWLIFWLSNLNSLKTPKKPLETSLPTKSSSIRYRRNKWFQNIYLIKKQLIYFLKKVSKRTGLILSDKKQVFRIKLWLSLFLLVFLCSISLFNSDLIFISALLPMSLIFIPIKIKTDLIFVIYEAVCISFYAILLLVEFSANAHLHLLSFLMFRIMVKVAWSTNIARQQSEAVV